MTRQRHLQELELMTHAHPLMGHKEELLPDQISEILQYLSSEGKIWLLTLSQSRTPAECIPRRQIEPRLYISKQLKIVM